MAYEQWHSEVCAALPTKGLPRELVELFRLAWSGPASYELAHHSVDMSEALDGQPSDQEGNIRAARDIADVMRQIKTKTWIDKALGIPTARGDFVVPVRWWNMRLSQPNLITVPPSPGKWAFLYSVATACVVAWEDKQSLQSREEGAEISDKWHSDVLKAVDALIRAAGKTDTRVGFPPILGWTADDVLFMAGDHARKGTGAAPTLGATLAALRQYLEGCLNAECIDPSPAQQARALSRRDSIRVYLRAALKLIDDYGYPLDQHVENHIRPIAELVSGEVISEEVIKKAKQS